MKPIYYVTPNEPGIVRKHENNKLSYYFPNGKKVTNSKTLKRIKSLAIPPAYKKVWICQKVNGHIQAYGFDDLNRKQYLYHKLWTKQQEKKKFNHLLDFGLSLSRIRTKIKKDLNAKLTKKKLLAFVVYLLDNTSIRIGSPQYDSYGLLTLAKKHINIRKNKVCLDFLGKSKQQWHVELSDKIISNMFKYLLIQPGNKIFQYKDEMGSSRKLTPNDVNEYLKNITGKDITAKEFRTWRASAYFIKLIPKKKEKFPETKSRILIDKVAKYIHNTPAVCKNSYLHPLILKLFINGDIGKINSFKKNVKLSKEENLLLHMLKNNK